MTSRIESEIKIKAKELVALYNRYNPSGSYLNLSIIRIGQDVFRIRCNNAFYDKDHRKPINITEDIRL